MGFYIKKGQTELSTDENTGNLYAFLNDKSDCQGSLTSDSHVRYDVRTQKGTTLDCAASTILDACIDGEDSYILYQASKLTAVLLKNGEIHSVIDIETYAGQLDAEILAIAKEYHDQKPRNPDGREDPYVNRNESKTSIQSGRIVVKDGDVHPYLIWMLDSTAYAWPWCNALFPDVYPDTTDYPDAAHDADYHYPIMLNVSQYCVGIYDNGTISTPLNSRWLYCYNGYGVGDKWDNTSQGDAIGDVPITPIVATMTLWGGYKAEQHQALDGGYGDIAIYDEDNSLIYVYKTTSALSDGTYGATTSHYVSLSVLPLDHLSDGKHQYGHYIYIYGYDYTGGAEELTLISMIATLSGRQQKISTWVHPARAHDGIDKTLIDDTQPMTIPMQDGYYAYQDWSSNKATIHNPDGSEICKLTYFVNKSLCIYPWGDGYVIAMYGGDVFYTENDDIKKITVGSGLVCQNVRLYPFRSLKKLEKIMKDFLDGQGGG